MKSTLSTTSYSQNIAKSNYKRATYTAARSPRAHTRTIIDSPPRSPLTAVTTTRWPDGDVRSSTAVVHSHRRGQAQRVVKAPQPAPQVAQVIPAGHSRKVSRTAIRGTPAPAPAPIVVRGGLTHQHQHTHHQVINPASGFPPGAKHIEDRGADTLVSYGRDENGEEVRITSKGILKNPELRTVAERISPPRQYITNNARVSVSPYTGESLHEHSTSVSPVMRDSLVKETVYSPSRPVTYRTSKRPVVPIGTAHDTIIGQSTINQGQPHSPIVVRNDYSPGRHQIQAAQSPIQRRQHQVITHSPGYYHHGQASRGSSIEASVQSHVSHTSSTVSRTSVTHQASPSYQQHIHGSRKVRFQEPSQAQKRSVLVATHSPARVPVPARSPPRQRQEIITKTHYGGKAQRPVITQHQQPRRVTTKRYEAPQPAQNVLRSSVISSRSISPGPAPVQTTHIHQHKYNVVTNDPSPRSHRSHISSRKVHQSRQKATSFLPSVEQSPARGTGTRVSHTHIINHSPSRASLSIREHHSPKAKAARHTRSRTQHLIDIHPPAQQQTVIQHSPSRIHHQVAIHHSPARVQQSPARVHQHRTIIDHSPPRHHQVAAPAPAPAPVHNHEINHSPSRRNITSTYYQDTRPTPIQHEASTVVQHTTVHHHHHHHEEVISNPGSGRRITTNFSDGKQLTTESIPFGPTLVEESYKPLSAKQRVDIMLEAERTKRRVAAAAKRQSTAVQFETAVHFDSPSRPYKKNYRDRSTAGSIGLNSAEARNSLVQHHTHVHTHEHIHRQLF